MVLAGILFLRSGIDQTKCLKIDLLCGFSCVCVSSKFLATCHKFDNAWKCQFLGLFCSKCLCIFLQNQKYIIITSFSSLDQFLPSNFEKSHEKPHKKKLAWSVPGRISQNLLVVFFIDTPRDIINRCREFWVSFNSFSKKTYHPGLP